MSAFALSHSSTMHNEEVVAFVMLLIDTEDVGSLSHSPKEIVLSMETRECGESVTR